MDRRNRRWLQRCVRRQQLHNPIFDLNSWTVMCSTWPERTHIISSCDVWLLVSTESKKIAASGRLPFQGLQFFENCIPLVMPNLEACSEPFQISVIVRKMLVVVLLSVRAYPTT